MQATSSFLIPGSLEAQWFTKENSCVVFSVEAGPPGIVCSVTRWW